jgi:hypothetical protein
VGRRVAVMKERVMVAPKFWFFSSHIFSQASQNVTVRVKVRVDRSVRRNKFTVNNPIHVEENNELGTCRVFFALGDRGLFHCDDRCFVSG